MTFRVNGKKVCESTKTANKRLAEKIYSKQVTDITEGRWFEQQDRKKTLGEMIERFKAEYTGETERLLPEGSGSFDNKTFPGIFRRECNVT